MSLQEYQRKRAFDRTREPSAARSKGIAERTRFVVQLHHASRRHYDFRLQVGDALKSWAVPKGPSYDPRVKRMAIEVEDHPLDYADFTGDIPKGEYGGGHVARFDHGYWASEGDVEAQLAKGHLRFELFGRKLKGGWHLVRSGKKARQPQWLLFKDDDAFAGKVEADDLLADVEAPPAEDARRAGSGKSGRKRLSTVAPARRRRRNWAVAALKAPSARRGKMPASMPTPQLARLVDRPPDGEAWLHELKWDGYRLMARIEEGRVSLWSRNGLDWTDRLPDIAGALDQLNLGAAIMDGELIAGAGARRDFNLLQATLSGEKQGMLTYVVFDLLHLDGVDLGASPLLARKELLSRVLGPARPAHLAYSSHIPGSGADAFALATERGFEGVVSKRADRPHRSGRGDDWRKSKLVEGDEYAVVGFTPPQGSRTGFGSLLLARPDDAGAWTYAGRVGSGFSDEMIRRITRMIGKAGGRDPTVRIPANDTDLRGARWFEPLFVIEVNVRGHASSGLLRQASFKSLREDKSVDALSDSDRRSGAQAPATGGSGRRTARRKGPKAPDETVRRLTSPERVVYPEDGFTKADVADYYAKVMDWFLPEIVGRPLSIIRCPEGLGGSCFFQKHHSGGMDEVGHVRLREESGKRADYLVVENAADVMALVQMNALEFHPWGARSDDPERADRVVFDLDPGPGISWDQVKEAALTVRDRLAEIGFQSFLRTSGGKGLHVVLPLRPRSRWPLVKNFARAFAEALVASEPQRYVSVATMSRRRNRIFVDYLRNSRGATSVASYSLRARPGAPVAVSLAWRELGRLKQSDAYSLATLPARLKRLKADPWEGIDGGLEQDLSRWETPVQD